MPSTTLDYVQSQSGPIPPKTLEEPMAKPLICSFFKRAPATPSLPGVINGRGNLSARITNSPVASTCRSAYGTGVSHPPPFPPSMEEAILLFPLSPSVRIPLRHSKRSGRVLNESETLQEKHAQEYRYLVPMLAYAIECTIAEHDLIRRKAGLPAYVSSASPPGVSPGGDGKTHDDSDDEAAAAATATEGGNASAGVADGAGDRNGALGFKVFQTAINAFSTREVPTISVHDYLKRIVKYTYVSPSVLVCCCLYIDRLLTMYPSLLLHPHNVFKFLVTSTRICSKVMDTRTLNNRDFSVVGGVTNEDINALEFTFVQLLQNRLYISHHTFDSYCGPLRRQAAHVDVEGEWDGTTLAVVLPTNGSRQAGYPHEPARPSLARNSTCGGSAVSRSRRSSIVSQNEYSISASQSGVPPMRSASRPAFPPSTSTAQSISVDGEFLTSARQPSAAPSRGESAAGTSARRHPMSSSANLGNGATTSRSPVLPQLHPPTTSGGGTQVTAPVIRNASSAAALRSSSNFEDTASSNGLVHTGIGTFMHHLQHAGQAFDAGDEIDDTRARSIPVPGPRGFSSSWDAVRTTRTLAAATGGGGSGLSSSVTAAARSGSPNTLHGSTSTNNGTGSGKNRSIDGITLSTDGASTPSHISGERTPTRGAFVASARADTVALPPVPQSGRRGRSGSFAGNSGAALSNVPPPPEFRQRQ